MTANPYLQHWRRYVVNPISHIELSILALSLNSINLFVIFAIQRFLLLVTYNYALLDLCTLLVQVSLAVINE